MEITKTKDHRYSIDGLRASGVTDIIHGAGLTWSPNEEHYRQRGTAVHLAVQLLHKGGYNDQDFAPDIHPFMRAYERFVRDSGYEPEVLERIVGSSRLRVCGTYDSKGPSRDYGKMMLDLKTGSTPPTVGIQLGAYHLLEEHTDDCSYDYRRICVTLKSDGSYHTREFSEPRWRQDFLACLRVYRLKEEFSIISKASRGRR